MPVHGKPGPGRLQLLPQRLPLLLRQQRPRKGPAELPCPRLELAATAGTSPARRQDCPFKARIAIVERTGTV